MSKVIRITALAALLFSPAAVRAQEPLGWPGLQAASLDTIYVTDDAGQRTEGKLLRLDADSLVMLVDGMERGFDRTRVLRIDKRGDSLKNGTLIGFALGLVFGGIGAGISDCPGDDPGGSCTGAKVAGFAGAVGIYTAVGTAVDAMIVGRTRVFDAGRQVAVRGISDSPRLALSISW